MIKGLSLTHQVLTASLNMKFDATGENWRLSAFVNFARNSFRKFFFTQFDSFMPNCSEGGCYKAAILSPFLKI